MKAPAAARTNSPISPISAPGASQLPPLLVSLRVRDRHRTAKTGFPEFNRSPASGGGPAPLCRRVEPGPAQPDAPKTIHIESRFCFCSNATTARSRVGCSRAGKASESGWPNGMCWAKGRGTTGLRCEAEVVILDDSTTARIDDRQSVTNGNGALIASRVGELLGSWVKTKRHQRREGN
jgi:hypothetical protein